MIDYIKLEEQIREQIKKLKDEIKNLEQNRDILNQEKNIIYNKNRDINDSLKELKFTKEKILKHKYEFLINIIAIIPTITITLIPIFLAKFILLSNTFLSAKFITQIISVIIYSLLTGIILTSIVGETFDFIKKRLVKKHIINIINSKEYINILDEIKNLNKEHNTNLNLEREKIRQIKDINNEISAKENDISELSCFLNFVSSKNISKENTLHITKIKK